MNIPAPLLKMTVMMWIFPRHLGRADSVHHSSKRSFHGCLTGLNPCLKNTLLSKGAWQQVTRIEDLCHTACPTDGSTTWTRVREVS